MACANERAEEEGGKQVVYYIKESWAVTGRNEEKQDALKKTQQQTEEQYWSWRSWKYDTSDKPFLSIKH